MPTHQKGLLFFSFRSFAKSLDTLVSKKKKTRMSLKYLAAYALASLSAAKPSKDDVSKILKATGAAVDAEELDFVFTAIAGRDVNTLIREGAAKLAASASSGAAPAAAAGKPAAAAAPAAKAPAKEEKKEEEEEGDGMFGLFE